MSCFQENEKTLPSASAGCIHKTYTHMYMLYIKNFSPFHTQVHCNQKIIKTILSKIYIQHTTSAPYCTVSRSFQPNVYDDIIRS